MKLARHSTIRGEGLAIWIIVLAIVAGGIWFIYASRKESADKGRAFAMEVTRKLAIDYDESYLIAHLNPQNQTARHPAWRERLFKNLRSFGPLAKPPETTGDITFTSQFFDSRGTFRTELTYPTMTAHFDLSISTGATGWRIDELNLVWNPPPPTPTPTPAITPTPTPSPTPEGKQRRRNR